MLAGGERPAGLPDGNFLEATVIADVDERMRVFHEEIFGPVLVAMPFDDEVGGHPPRERDAVRARRLRVDQRPAPRPSRRARDRHRHVLDQLAERPRPAHAVRRGQGESGIGREGGDYAFDFYCETEVVHVALGSASHPAARPRRRGLAIDAARTMTTATELVSARRRARRSTSCAPRTPSCA